MELLANKIAAYLGKNLNKDDEQTSVIAYGLIALLQTASIFLLALVIGIVFNFLPEAMISFFSVGFLRRLIGGHHSQKLYSCLIVSVLCIVLFSSLARYVLVPYSPLWLLCSLTAIIYITAFILTYKLAPVDNPNKRIRTEEKRTRLRRNSFVVLALFVLISLIFIILQYNLGGIYSRLVVSLAISVLWQVFMLTTTGKYLISNIDSLF